MKQQQEGFNVILEKISNLKETIECNHRENKEEHQGIMKRQDHTNGDVSRLKMWRAYLLGAWVVISFTSTVLLPVLGYYFIKSVRQDIKLEMEEEIKKSISDNNDKFFELDNK